MRLILKFCGLALLLLASAANAQKAVEVIPPEQAPEMKNPTVASVNVDWSAARAELAAFDHLTRPEDAAGTAARAAPDALTRLNAATEKIFSGIAASAVPVLLPFDTAAFLDDRSRGTAGAGDNGKYFSGFHATFFAPGPSGYDGAFSLSPQDSADLDLTFARRVDVQISGSALVYALGGPAIADGSPVTDLEGEFPGIRRVILESHVHYTFERFGVPYVVSILCFDGPRRMRRLSCREADKVAVRFLRALHIVGGEPQRQTTKTPPQTIERPEKISPDFTFYAPGDILPGTGMRGQAGRADATVYSRIRFPIAQAPAYTNSQSFMNWGNCDLTGRVVLGGHGKDFAYRCRVNALPLVHDEARNYAYPWRDNFCEHRYYYVTQCPAGLGHQGEDIRPGSCKLRNQEADRCEPYQDDVVAVRDGVALRAPGDEALYLVVNTPGEHIRFRYLHMNPRMLDAAGMVSGRRITEGEVLGQVGDYGEREGGTTYHLHFDVQVPTRHGWVFVNPYMTLVAAYERLIGGRGRVVRDAPVAAAAVEDAADSANPSESDAILNHQIDGERPAVNTPGRKSEPKSDRRTAHGDETGSERQHGKSRIVGAEHCQTRVVKGHRRRACGFVMAGQHGRARHALVVRAMDRRLSRQGHRARHHAGHLHAHHEHGRARHHRA